MRLRPGLAAALALGAMVSACVTKPPPAAPTVSAAPPAPTLAVLSPPPALPSAAPARAATPAPAPCKTDLGPAPAYPDSAKALREAPDLFERMKLLLAARELRMEREAALTQALKACGAR